MTKYHAHEAIIATGPDTGSLPPADDFHNGIPAALHPLIIGPVIAPGSDAGMRCATYVFLPDGEDSWHQPELDGDEARRLFVYRLAEWLPDFEAVRVRFGTKAYSEDGRYDAEAEDER